MAKVTRIEEHDWLAVRARFPDGTQANVTWGRGGERVTVTPDSPKRAEALSLIVMENLARIRAKDPAYPFKDLGATTREMERVGKAATTFEGYVDGLKAALQVKGERPKPKGEAREATEATLASKRGWQLDVNFRSGERMSLKINRSSVGLILEPQVASKFDEVTKLVFGAKQAGVVDDDALAAKARDVALASGDLDEWIEGLRGDLFPQAAPRR